MNLKVEIRVELLGAEGVDLGGETLRDMGTAEVLACDRSVLGLRQGVVVGALRARLGEFHP